MTSNEQQRSVEMPAGFSPRPLTVAAPDNGTSPSGEPETPSPNALLEGPIIQRSTVSVDPVPDVIVKDGIVSFGK
jgi:hypothetical protein